MIRKLTVFVVLVVLASIGGMIYFHQKSLDEPRKKLVQLDLLHRRQSTISDMAMGLERYRRQSAGFRKLTDEQIEQAKTDLRNTFHDNMGQFERLDPTSAERAEAQKVSDKLDELMQLADHYEKVTVSKDAYQKAETVALHKDIEDKLDDLSHQTEGRIEKVSSEFRSTGTQSLRLLFGAGGLILAMLCLLIALNYFYYVQPLQAVHKYAARLRVGGTIPAEQPKLAGQYDDILSSLNYLASAVDSHIKERHKFILDVASDLKAPLTMLQAGKHLLARPSDGSAVEGAGEAADIQSLDSVKRGLAMLSGSLDDLNDLVEFGRLDGGNEENVVDLTDVVSEVARQLNAGPGLRKQITTSFPPMPMWALIDSRRIERVLIQTISKVASTLPKGAGIHLSVTQPQSGNFRGVEILIQDSEKARHKGGSAGPELDIMKHWISEKGLSMSLAAKIVRAQGGSLTASGVTGTSVSVCIRLPQERVASLGLISAPRGLEVNFSHLMKKDGTSSASNDDGAQEAHSSV